MTWFFKVIGGAWPSASAAASRGVGASPAPYTTPARRTLSPALSSRASASVSGVCKRCTRLMRDSADRSRARPWHEAPWLGASSLTRSRPRCGREEHHPLRHGLHLLPGERERNVPARKPVLEEIAVGRSEGDTPA